MSNASKSKAVASVHRHCITIHVIKVASYVFILEITVCRMASKKKQKCASLVVHFSLFGSLDGSGQIFIIWM